MLEYIKKVKENYITIIGTDAFSLYCYMILSYKTGDIVDEKHLSKILVMSENILNRNRMILKLSGLIMFTNIFGEDYKFNITISEPRELSLSDKSEILEKLKKSRSKLISDRQYEEIKESLDINLNELKDDEVVKPIKEKKSKIFDKDTTPGLLSFYYKTLSDNFGKQISSLSFHKELSVIHNIRKTTGDSPDKIRKIMEFVIKNNTFDKISNLNFFSSFYKNAAFRIEEEKSKEMLKPIEENTNRRDEGYIEKTYEYMKLRNMSKESIRKVLINNFDEDFVDSFLEKK